MAKWLIILAAFAEDLSSNTHNEVAHTPSSRGNPTPLASTGTGTNVYIPTYTYIHIIRNNKYI